MFTLDVKQQINNNFTRRYRSPRRYHVVSSSDLHAMFKDGWGGRVVLGKLPVPVRPTNLDYNRTRPTALAVGADGGCWDIFSLVYYFSFLSPSLWETARDRLKYCLKGPLSPKQPTNQYQGPISPL